MDGRGRARGPRSALNPRVARVAAARLAPSGRDYQLGRLTSEQFWTRVAEASMGVYSSTDVERIWQAWSREEYPGVAAVFDALDRLEVTTAVLSNTNSAHWRRLAALDAAVPEYPTVLRAQYRFASHLLGLAKPDPAVYRHVSVATGIPADRILFFDDTPEHVDGAYEAGWSAERIDREGDTAAQLLGWLEASGVIPEAPGPPPPR